jgi:Family of unknown function (DUF6309)
LAPVEFAEVLARFRSEHSVDDTHEWNSNSDGEAHLLCADRLTDRWDRVLLGPEEIGRVVLPWHESEGGDLKLVPKTGLTVADATEVLRAVSDRYPTESPVCWRKIARMNAGPSTPLYLSAVVIDMSDYEELEVTGDGLIHLDGLHRMVSWQLNGVLTSGCTVEAYVAGL